MDIFAVSTAQSGTPVMGDEPSLSSDGRFVVFYSDASNMVL